MASVLTIKTSEDLAQLSARLSQTGDLLDAVGVILKDVSLAAFGKQALGSFPWPERYYGKGEPFINIAGALTDLADGPRVKARRFDKRPALIDSGNLQRSFEHGITSSDTVEVKNVAEYADRVHAGGKSVIPITPGVKANMSRWLSTAQGKPYRPRLGPFFNDTQYEIETIPRPLVGVPDETAKELAELTEEWAAGGF